MDRVSTRLASFKAVGLGVREFQADHRRTVRLLREAAHQAVLQDRAEVIVLGCTMEVGFYKQLQQELGVPVIDAVLAALKYAEFLVELRKRAGWLHSKACGYDLHPWMRLVLGGYRARRAAIHIQNRLLMDWLSVQSTKEARLEGNNRGFPSKDSRTVDY